MWKRKLVVVFLTLKEWNYKSFSCHLVPTCVCRVAGTFTSHVSRLESFFPPSVINVWALSTHGRLGGELMVQTVKPWPSDLDLRPWLAGYPDKDNIQTPRLFTLKINVPKLNYFLRKVCPFSVGLSFCTLDLVLDSPRGRDREKRLTVEKTSGRFR